MEFTEILRMMSGPVIGAVIGYFTNMIAVKMLFYPKEEICVFGRRLPLTPGVIPKGRPRLASSVGEVIEKYLLTKEDITSHLLTEQAENKVADAVMEKLSMDIRDLAGLLVDTEGPLYEEKKERFCKALSAQIVKAIESSDATDTVLKVFAEAMTQKVSATPLRLLVNDRTVGKVLQPIKDALDNIIEERGEEYIFPVILQKVNDTERKSGLALLMDFDADEQAVRDTVKSVYRRIVSDSVDGILKSVNISALVEEKINAMPIDELERLVQEVMKKELNAIINLGALIGFILGLLNLLVG